MSLHVFANFVTPFGTAANNRAENEGNITTLQKILWMGETHSTVSAEAIRFALRRRFATLEKQGTNRTWNDDLRRNEWQSGREIDTEFAKWADKTYLGFIDDDLLGFMAAEAAKEEVEDTDTENPETGTEKGKVKWTPKNWTEVDPILWTKKGHSLATLFPAFLTGNF